MRRIQESESRSLICDSSISFILDSKFWLLYSYEQEV
jgi:hypothetical protein